jgi:hypothetical protein
MPVMQNTSMERADLQFKADAFEEWLDKVYPADIFSTLFNRKQIAWAVANYLKSEIYDKFYLTSVGNND